MIGVEFVKFKVATKKLDDFDRSGKGEFIDWLQRGSSPQSFNDLTLEQYG